MSSKTRNRTDRSVILNSGSAITSIFAVSVEHLHSYLIRYTRTIVVIVIVQWLLQNSDLGLTYMDRTMAVRTKAAAGGCHDTLPYRIGNIINIISTGTYAVRELLRYILLAFVCRYLYRNLALHGVPK